MKTNDSFRTLLESAGMTTLGDWMNAARDVEQPSGRQETFTVFELGGEDGFRVYLKRYRAGQPSLRLFLRRSRQRTEAESAWMLRTLGIPTAEVVAVGERRSFGRLTEAFVATREIAGARPIDELTNESGLSRSARTAAVEKLAQMIRRMHDGHYVDRDLYCRNLLFTRSGNGEVDFYLIDSPRGSVCVMDIRSGKVRDLASLNRDARELLSATDRLRFMKTYLGRDKLTGSDRRFCRRIERRTRPVTRREQREMLGRE